MSRTSSGFGCDYIIFYLDKYDQLSHTANIENGFNLLCRELSEVRAHDKDVTEQANTAQDEVSIDTDYFCRDR